MARPGQSVAGRALGLEYQDCAQRGGRNGPCFQRGKRDARPFQLGAGRRRTGGLEPQGGKPRPALGDRRVLAEAIDKGLANALLNCWIAAQK